MKGRLKDDLKQVEADVTGPQLRWGSLRVGSAQRGGLAGASSCRVEEFAKFVFLICLHQHGKIAYQPKPNKLNGLEGK